MITREQAQRLKLKSDEETLLLIENALNWINLNTTLKVSTEEVENLQPNVKLFIRKYLDIMSLPTGITSESAGGLSQSFENTDKNELLLQNALALFGESNVTYGKVTFVEARRRMW